MKTMYESVLDQILSGSIDVLTDDISVQLLDNTYSFSAGDQVHGDLTGLVGDPAVLGGRTLNAGEFFANPGVVPVVAAGSTVTAVVVFKDTGDLGTSPLLMYTDEDNVGDPLSLATDDQNIEVEWPSGVVFTLGLG